MAQGPSHVFVLLTTSRSGYRDLWPVSDRTITVQLFWSIIYMSSHVSPRFCSERSPGNADTGPQDVPSQEPSRCQDCGSGPSSGSTACPGAVPALRVPSPHGPAHGQASEFPVDCRSPISSVLVKEFLSFAAPDATLQPVCLSHCSASSAAPELPCQLEAAPGVAAVCASRTVFFFPDCIQS